MYDGSPHGPAARAVTIARHLASRGYRTAFARGGASRPLLADAVSIARGLPSSPRPDVILAFAPPLASALYARALAMRMGVPYALIVDDAPLSESGPGAAASRFAFTAAARSASAVAVSGDEERYMLERGGVAADRIRRAPRWSAIPEHEADAGLVRQRLGIPDDATLSLYAGPLDEGLGLENLIYAARLAGQRHPSYRFILAGRGPRAGVLREMLRWYRITNTVIIDPLPDEMLTAADVLVAPSASRGDALSTYFAAGRPIIAAADRHAGIAREINESSAGIVVPPGQPARLVDVIERTATDGALKLYLTQAARRWAVTQRSESRAMRAYEQIVAATLARGGTATLLAPVERPAGHAQRAA
jgi:glycosyltransferase involved in cell wall biosynthesis